MRKKIECAELLAADLFRNADQDRYRITLGCVEKYLAQLAMHPRDCTCGRCWMVSQVSAQRVFFVASAWQREIRATRVRARAEPGGKTRMVVGEQSGLPAWLRGT